MVGEKFQKFAFRSANWNLKAFCIATVEIDHRKALVGCRWDADGMPTEW